MIPDVPVVSIIEEKDPDQKHIGWYEYTGGHLYGLQYTKQCKVCYNISINICILISIPVDKYKIRKCNRTKVLV